MAPPLVPHESGEATGVVGGPPRPWSSAGPCSCLKPRGFMGLRPLAPLACVDERDWLLRGSGRPLTRSEAGVSAGEDSSITFDPPAAGAAGPLAREQTVTTRRSLDPGGDGPRAARWAWPRERDTTVRWVPMTMDGRPLSRSLRACQIRGDQTPGGSRRTSLCYLPFRSAGACSRALLITVAAEVPSWSIAFDLRGSRSNAGGGPPPACRASEMRCFPTFRGKTRCEFSPRHGEWRLLRTTTGRAPERWLSQYRVDACKRRARPGGEAR
jgi:hypothetical protein